MSKPYPMVESAQSTQASIEQLRDLIIDFHYQADPWYKTWAPYLIALGVGLLTISGQWFIFWLTKKKELDILKINTKKEINIKVAELYGKYKAQSMSYNIVFFKYNIADAAYKYNLFMNNHFLQIIGDDEQRGAMTEEEIDELYNKQKYYAEKINSSNENANVEFELFKTKKTTVIELLHQIHFYYADTELEKLINNFQNIFSFKFDLTVFKEEMANSNFLESYSDSNIKPLNVTIKELLDNISARILLLAKS